MSDLVTCPACSGRGIYCLRVLDPVWPLMTTQENLCELCDGRGKIAAADVEEFDLVERTPYSPYHPYDE